MSDTGLAAAYRTGGFAAVWPRIKRPVRDALILVGIGRAIYYFWVQGVRPWEFPAIDARAYWGIDLAHPYAGGYVGGVSDFLYSPVFAQLMAPFSLIPFPLFFTLWTALNLGLFIWLVKPYPLAGVMLILPVIYELCVGNVHFILAALTVVGARLAWVWAFPVLTKVFPGVGALWFAGRGEWRNFGVAVGTTLALVAVSYVVNPTAWHEWITFLLQNRGSAQYPELRLIASAGIVIVGARKGWAWTIAVATWIAIPLVYVNAWVVLLGTIRLSRMKVEPVSGLHLPAILRRP